KNEIRVEIHSDLLEIKIFLNSAPTTDSRIHYFKVWIIVCDNVGEQFVLSYMRPFRKRISEYQHPFFTVGGLSFIVRATMAKFVLGDQDFHAFGRAISLRITHVIPT